MTYRQQINRRIGAWAYMPMTGVAIFLVGLFAIGHRGSSVALFVLIGFFGAGMIPAMFVLLLRLVCPRCKNTLMPLIRYAILPAIRVPKKVRFCPVCGLDLEGDTESEQPPA